MKQRRSLITAMTGLVVVAAAASFAVTVAPAATADTQICDQYGSTTIQGGRYVVTNNRWGTSATQCINVTDTGFAITQADGTTATNGPPKSFPTAIYGCHYGNCGTSDNLLSPNGMRASDPRFRGISTNVSMTLPDSGVWDAAYDIWFNKSMPSLSTGQNDGAEVMVWLNHRGSIQPIGSQVGTATIAGATWDVWEGNIGWNVISYVRQSTTSSVSFAVSDFFDDVVSRGYGSNDWYLTSIQAGFEPWESGVGLAVNGFAVTTGSTPTSTPTSMPTSMPSSTPTTPPPGGCKAALTVVSSWDGGFQAAVTVTAGSSAISKWSTSFTLPEGASIGNLWSGTLSGSAYPYRYTVKDAGYNGALAAGQSTSYGFTATGSAPSDAGLPTGLSYATLPCSTD